jgi:hypothetical protein
MSSFPPKQWFRASPMYKVSFCNKPGPTCLVKSFNMYEVNLSIKMGPTYDMVYPHA